MTEYATVEALMASDEYQALGVCGRDRMLREHFPDVDAEIKRSAARVTELARFGKPITPKEDA